MSALQVEYAFGGHREEGGQPHIISIPRYEILRHNHAFSVFRHLSVLFTFMNNAR